MAIYKVPVKRGKYTSYTSGGKTYKLPNYFTVDNRRDYKMAIKKKWYGTPSGYAESVTKTGRIAAHTWIRQRADGGVKLYRAPSGYITKAEVDHKNRSRWDNRRANLRQVTKQQNQLNKNTSKKKQTNGVTNFIGKQKFRATFIKAKIPTRVLAKEKKLNASQEAHFKDRASLFRKQEASKNPKKKTDWNKYNKKRREQRIKKNGGIVDKRRKNSKRIVKK